MSDSKPEQESSTENSRLDFLFKQINTIFSRQSNQVARVRKLQEEVTELKAQVRAQQGPDKGTQILLALKYQALAAQGQFLPFESVEFQSYSQFKEDGILLYIFSLIGTTNRRCVELCAGNGIESMSANLIINHGWNALLIDGDESRVEEGQHFFRKHPATQYCAPRFINSWIRKDNVNELLRSNGFVGEIDLFSLDMDGVDYWIWDALDVISPRVVVVEINTHMGTEPITVPYSDEFAVEWLPIEAHRDDSPSEGTKVLSDWSMYGGASLAAFNKLAKRKGYRLVGSNDVGFNVFFVRNDIECLLLPEITELECFSEEAAIDRARAEKVLLQKELVRV